MDKYFDYIDKSLPENNQANPILYKFKRETLSKMTARANELTSIGLKDKKVVDDLIISEYANIVDDYKAYEQEQTKSAKRKKKLIINAIGSVAYLIIMMVAYIGISMVTLDWNKTWVIIVDGVLLWIAYLLSLGVHRVLDMKRIFHFIARIMLAIAVMLLSVAVFMLGFGVLDIPNSWVLVLTGVFTAFLCDGLFASLTKQKLAVINWLVYIPVMSVMLFLILGALSVLPFGIGWALIPISLLIDIVVIFVRLKMSKNYDEEVVDEWQEN